MSSISNGGVGADPLLGQQVGEFLVDRLIASGGMGAVYLLRHAFLPNIRKVLKVILKEYADRQQLRERFLAEADAMAQLGSHPCIVGIDNVMTLPDGQLGIIAPFVDGVPLHEYIQQHGGQLPPHRVMHVISHVARALHHAHTHKIVHRDLKPSNVFVEVDDNDAVFCRVLDFGVAKRLSPSAHVPSPTLIGPLGTPDYMPPEQQNRAAQATPAADIFALACMIWEMVTGALPWGRQDDPAILYVRKLNDPPDPPRGTALSPEWEAILRHALHPDPTTRPSLQAFMVGLALALPAIGRIVPSGAEILQRHARKLAEEGHADDVTLRNPSNRTLMPAWPQRDAPLPPPRSAPHLAPSSSAPHLAPSSSAIGAPWPAQPVPVMGTTIGSSAGAVLAAPSTPVQPGRWKLALVGASALALAGVGTFVVASAGRRGTVQPAAEVTRGSGEASTPTATATSPAATVSAPPSAATSPVVTASAPTAATTPPPATPPVATASSPTSAATPPAATVSAPPSAVALPASRAATTAVKVLDAPKPGQPTRPKSTTPKTSRPKSMDDKATEPAAPRKFDPNAVVGGQE